MAQIKASKKEKIGFISTVFLILNVSNKGIFKIFESLFSP